MKLRFTSVVLLALALAVCAPAGASTIYSNGPINGTIDAWNTYFFFGVTDSFVASTSATVTGFDGGFWLAPGNTPISTSWSIGTTAFGSDIASGSANYSNSLYCSGCGNGYDIYTSTVSGLSVPIAAGTYWLTLGNAVTAHGTDLFWDENDGPSTAYQTFTGSIGSEAFNVYGITTQEPGTLLMLSSGVIGLAAVIRRKLSL
jgi:hypothetical protein